MSFYIKVISGILMFSLGRSHTWLLAVFFLMDVSLPNATFSFFNLSLTDIIDDDVVRFQRRSPLSSMMFGTNALFTKPAQSVAPMLVVSILNRHGYQSAISHGHIEDNPELLDAIFLLVCAVPTVLGVCQLLAWLQYTLRSSHLVTPKYIET
uniref:Uncharacterized protein LOC100376329 n=1 Tax=Saccoglossus kowalevskii TaxID=10224 RepID=A0ABM0MJB5_SACKO|nr:PREDICTED: uncharacterized protein LOC100376329 [Saccoglossus kowalevskii]